MSVASKAPEPAGTSSPDVLAQNLCWLLSQASYALATELTAALEDLGISPRSHCVLSTAMTGELTQTELAQAVGLDKTTMVVTIDELETAGLAERRPSQTDRRARVIGVTKAGQRKVARGRRGRRARPGGRARHAPRQGAPGLPGGALAGSSATASPTPAECQHSPRRRAARAVARYLGGKIFRSEMIPNGTICYGPGTLYPTQRTADDRHSHSHRPRIPGEARPQRA